MRFDHLRSSPLAGMSARGAHSGVVLLLVLGSLLVLAGAVRFLGFFPGLRVHLLGQGRLPSAVEGLVILLVGAALLVLGTVLMSG
jgi:hypothetical protein